MVRPKPDGPAKAGHYVLIVEVIIERGLVTEAPERPA